MIVFEQLSFIQALKSVVSQKDIYFFEATRPAQWLVKDNNRIKQLKWRLVELCNDKGEMLEAYVEADFVRLCDEFQKKELNGNEFLRIFYPDDPQLVSTYILKLIQNKITDKLYLIAFLNNLRIKKQIEEIDFFIKGDLFVDYLSKYAAEKKIRVQTASVRFSYRLKEFAEAVGYSIAFPILEFFKTIFNFKRMKIEDGSPRLGLWYNFNPMAMVRDQRSALFLFLESHVPLNKLIIYFENPGNPCTLEMVDEMDKHKIRYIARKQNAARDPRVPLWSATGKFFLVLFKRNLQLVVAAIKEIFDGRSKNLMCVEELFKFNAIYALHYDFYKTLNIKVNVGLDNFSSIDVPKYLALKDTGGVRVCYQMSNISPSVSSHGVISDVYFSFGPYYQKPLELSRSMIKHLIFSGYITDYSFKAVKQKAAELRGNLSNAGAKFIITFLDEGFGKDQYQFSRQEAGLIHDFFAGLVLKYPDIGIIHKPKKVTYNPDTPTVREALKTNRFFILNDGKYLIKSFPAEATQAADLTIGMLQSGTAILEAMLVGLPAFYLDLHKLYSFDEYKYGKDKIVFDDLKTLESAILKLKEDRDHYYWPPELLEVLRAKDPFQDGHSVNRIGDYLFWLLEKFDEKAEAAEALSYALKKYRNKWVQSQKPEHEEANYLTTSLA